MTINIAFWFYLICLIALNYCHKSSLKAFFKVHIKEHSFLLLFIIYRVHTLHRSNKWSSNLFKLILFSFCYISILWSASRFPEQCNYSFGMRAGNKISYLCKPTWSYKLQMTSFTRLQEDQFWPCFYGWFRLVKRRVNLSNQRADVSGWSYCQ